MNILLVYPQFPNTLWSFKHALKFIGKKAYSPPLGLLTVAALLPQGWEKRLVDLNVTTLSDKDLAWADYAFISAMVVQKESVRQIIARCKKAGIPIVAGGPLFMSERENYEDIDHLILNEAEITLPSFLSDLEKGCARHIYATSDFADVRKSPKPLWELADLKQYGSMSLQFTRGCPFQCEFCSVSTFFGRGSRAKSTEQILAELDKFYHLGWRGSAFFVDDNFIGNKRYLKTELLPALIQWQKSKEGMPFYTAVSITVADDEQLMQMMVDAGFDQVFIGIETPNEESLAECGKKQNKKRNLVEDVKRIQRAGLQVQGGFIVGFDNDKTSIFQRQIDFIQQSGIVTATVGILQAFPGTKLYERMRQENRLLGEMSLYIVDGTTNFTTAMNLNTLKEGYQHIMRYIYSPVHFYQRVKTFLREYKRPAIEAPLNKDHIFALFRSLYHLGIAGKERVYFWKLLLWTCFHRPDLFSLSIKLAIYGHHFRKVVDRNVL